jgi:hypothetical protein
MLNKKVKLHIDKNGVAKLLINDELIGGVQEFSFGIDANSCIPTVTLKFLASETEIICEKLEPIECFDQKEIDPELMSKLDLIKAFGEKENKIKEFMKSLS